MGSETERRRRSRRRSTLGDEEKVRMKTQSGGKTNLIPKCSSLSEREKEEEASGFALEAILFL